MGYFSQLAIEQMEMHECYSPLDTEYVPRREWLEYHMSFLQEKLATIELVRPRDPLHPAYDRMFYAQSQVHYYENPQTVQDLLFAIAEVKECLWELECSEAATRREQKRQAELASLEQALDGQILMVSCWDYANIFREAKAYRSMLSVLRVA